MNLISFIFLILRKYQEMSVFPFTTFPNEYDFHRNRDYYRELLYEQYF